MESPSPQSGEVNKAAGSPRGDAKGPSDDLLRFEDHADAMGSTFSIIVYGADRANMEAAVDAAFWIKCFRITCRPASGARSIVQSLIELWGYRRNCSVCFPIASNTAGKAKGHSISRWDD